MKVSRKKLLKRLERLEQENKELKTKYFKAEKCIYEFVLNEKVTEDAFVIAIGYKVWMDCEELIWFGSVTKKEDENK